VEALFVVASGGPLPVPTGKAEKALFELLGVEAGIELCPAAASGEDEIDSLPEGERRRLSPRRQAQMLMSTCRATPSKRAFVRAIALATRSSIWEIPRAIKRSPSSLFVATPSPSTYLKPRTT
jgi:hypothetical protein